MAERLLARVTELLAEVLGDADFAVSIRPESDIVTELGLDSIQMINFLLRVEDTLGVELDFENLDLSHMSSVRGFCEYLAGLDPQPA